MKKLAIPLTHAALILVVGLLGACGGSSGGSSQQDAISLPLSSNVQLASDGAGNFLAVWESGISIVARYYNQGVGGQDVILGQGSRPRVALSSSYGHVVWSDLDDLSQPDLQGRVLSAATGTWRENRDIAAGYTGGGQFIWPDVAAAGDQGMLVYQRWAGFDNSNRDLFGFEFINASNDDFPEPLWLDFLPRYIVQNSLSDRSATRTEPKVAINLNRDSMVIWTNPNDDSVHIVKYVPAQAITSLSGFLGSWPLDLRWSFRFFTGGEPVTTRGYDVGLFSNGDAMISWLQGNRIIVNRYNNFANTWESADQGQLIGFTQTGSVPAMAIHDQGYALVVAHQLNTNNIRAHHYIPGQPWNSAWQAPIVLNTGGTISGNPDVSIAPNGQAMAVWTEDGNITFSLFDGQNWQSPIVVGQGEKPKVALENNGNCLIAWEQDGFIFDYNCNLPSASFSFSPTTPLPGDSINFDASPSSDSAGTITNYQWDFDNDGVFDTSGIMASYSFANAGTFPVRLRVTNDRGFTNEALANVAVGQSATLTVNAIGDGTITSSPVGIDCGLTTSLCSTSFALDTAITLTATPEPGFMFSGWGGDCAAATSTDALITLSASHFCSAQFTAVGGGVAVLLTEIRVDGVTPTGNGPFGGTITSVRAGIDCGTQNIICEQGFVRGRNVVLTATPDVGFHFDSWSGGCSGATTTITIVMNNDRNCIANYLSGNAGMPTLTVAVNGNGQASSDPAGIVCGNDCTEDFVFATNVFLAANGIGGAAFQGWTGDCSGTSVGSLTMDSNKNCIANFGPAPGNSRLTMTVVGQGTVTTSDSGIICSQTDCIEDYPNGSNVQVFAAPEGGIVLQSWGGDCASFGNNPTVMLSMQTDMNCTATFGF